MEAYEINYHLARKKISLGDLADGLDVSKPSVSQVIHGVKTSKRISQAVADAIGRPLEEVFPKYSRQAAQDGTRPHH